MNLLRNGYTSCIFDKFLCYPHLDTLRSRTLKISLKLYAIALFALSQTFVASGAEKTILRDNSLLDNPPVATTQTYSTAGTYTFTVPAGVTTITVDTWGGGGRGGSRTSGSNAYGGGGGGAFSRHTLSVTPGQTYTVTVGAGATSTAAGGDSWVSINTVGNAFVLAKGGLSVANNTVAGAAGGSAASGIGSIKFSGGNGANGVSPNAGGGGSSASSYGNGNAGTGSTGGVALTKGGNGGNGRTGTDGPGLAGTAPGGGGGGSYRTSTNTVGGNGGSGRVIITYAATEICNNGIDDDGDGLIDSADHDCVSYCGTGSILLERWLNVNGSNVTDLTSNANYPNNPSQSLEITSFTGGSNIAENYGSRARGYLTPSLSGYYLFNLTSDDQGELYLSTDANPANKALIASVSGWTGFNEYTKFPTQTSVEIYLIAGQNYYIEVLHKEGGGGDHFLVSWETPTMTTWDVIPDTNLRPIRCAEICGNGVDDDVDGLTDCADNDCSTSVTLSTPVVSGCINQPLQDIATVSTIVSWTSAPLGGKLKIAHDNKIEWIDVAGGATSPQTIVFNVVANGSTGNTITASWDLGTGCTVATSAAFTKPASCSSDQINCNILYLCGLDKPYDGEPWDKGFMGYVMSQNGGTTSAALTKPDGTGYGLYDIMNQNTQLSINLDNYSMIVISPTTEGHMATDLINALKGWKGSILNMNYAIMPSLGYSPNNYLNWSNNAYINAVETLLNYDNPTSYQGKLMTVGDYYATAIPSVWKDAGSKTANLGGISFRYAPHTNTQISSTHGTRVFLGYHMNGLYGNTENLGALPAPVSSYFAPNKHLTTMGKLVLDNALISAATCTVEVCSNGLDDDGDGLYDCLDPNCNDLINGEFDNGTANWDLFVQGGAVATRSVDATNQLSGSNSMRVITTATNGTEWHVQLSQGGESLVAGKTYRISFKAKASAARNASVSLGLGISPYTTYFYQTFSLTTTNQNYSFEFTASTSISNNINFLFNLAAVNGTVWIDQVEFKEACPPPVLSCGGQCPSQNKLVNGSFDTNVSGWTSPTGVLELGGCGTYGNLLILNNADAAGPFTVYQDFAIGANQQFLFTGYAAKHGSSNNAKVYLEYYNGNTFISKSVDFNVTKNYDCTWDPITPILGFTPAGTTKIRVVGYCAGTAIKLDELSIAICGTCPEICNNGIDDDGDGLTDCADPDCGVVANAGPDVTQCNNGAFILQANALNPGETGVWSTISGNIYVNGDIYSNSITAVLTAGSTGTGRWTVSKGGCSAFDNIVLTNNNTCSTPCIDPINVNGDLEAEGNATNFNLSYQGTPALLIEGVTNPEGWASRYGTNPTSTTNFTGAFYLKKTGASGNPRSGTHMIYLKGAGFCLSTLQNIGNLSCGKTYQFSVWAAAYSNTTTQGNAPFALEFGAGSDSGTPVPYYSHVELMAPASTSWNNLNWQRYVFIVTIPENGYDWSDFYFTSYDNTHGIVLDDVCVTEISTGSYADAGPDQRQCTNFFNLNANTPPVGYTGTWSVVSGNVSFSNANSPTSTVTITSGSTARIKWLVSNGSCWTFDETVISYTGASGISVNNPTICPGTNTTLTVSGCTGNVVWSTGETTTSITVNPTATTNYTVTCTPASSGNLVLNPGFESATNFQNWTDWGQSGITTVAGEVRTGTKAAKVNTINSWGGFGQDIAVTPGELITFTFWGKALNTNVYSSFDYKFMTSAWADVTQYKSTRISTSTYTQYSVTMVVPPNAAWLQLAFTSNTPSILYIDDISLIKMSGCVSTATSTVSITSVGCQEICDNGIDDNNNGLIDSLDPFCNCANTTNGGIISGNEISCTNYNPGIISNVSAASGNAGTIQYQWEYSNNNINWVQISGATSLTYDPGFIYQTTYFRRKSKISTCGYWGATSNTVTKQDFSFDNFQVLTLGDVNFNGSTHVHGPLAAGGNLNINSAGAKVEVNMDNIGTYIFPGDGSVSTGLMIRGGVNFSSGYLGVLSNRYIHIGNSANLASSDNGTNSSTRVFPFGTNYDHSLRIETTIDQTPLPAVFQTVGYDFDNLFSYFNANSNSLGARTNNVQLYNSSNVAITNNIVSSSQPIRIKDLVTGYNYLNLTTSSINNISEWNFETNGQPSATKVLVINVPITANFNWNNSNVTGLVASTHAPYIIWNFYGSTVNTVTVSGNSLIFGSIMAPNQNVIKTGINDIEGSIIARSATLGNGQLHDFMFADFCGLFSCTNVVSASVTGTNTICQGSSTTLTATGGGSYVWSTGATTASITVTPSTTTTYTVTVTESSGCTASANRTVTVNASPTAAITGTNTICTGVSTTLTASGGTSYIWSNAATTAAITVSPTATTTYIVTVTNAQGCTATSSRTVTVNALPTAAISGTNTICNGASTTLTASGGTSYIWTTAATTAAITVSPVVTTTYIVTVTNAQGCTATSSRTVTVNALPAATISGNNIICTGASTTLTASGGSSYVWSNTATTAAITVNPTSTTTYIVTVTNAQGCTATSSRTVTVNALPVATISGNNTICTGASTTLTASGGSSYVWSNAATTAAITVNPTSTTTYIVTATDAQGCTATASRTVTVNALPAAAISGTNTICTGASTTLTASGGTSYLWSNAATTANITVNPSVTTTYIVTVTNAQGCTATSSRSVTVNALPTAAISGTNTICTGASTTLTASGGTSYLWSNAATTAAITVNPSATTAYIVTVTNAQGCTATSSRTVTVNSLPTALISGTNNICNGESTTLTASGGTSYLWSNAATTAAITVSPTTNTNYIVTVTNVQGCTATSNVNVTVKTLPIITSTVPDSRCGTGTLVLQATADAGTLNWYDIASGGTSIGTGTSFTTPSITATTTYYVEALNNGCISSSRTAVVATIKPIPGSKIISSASRCGTGSVTLSVLFGSGNSIWYSVPTGGTALFTGDNFTTPSLSTTTTYYIEAELNGCVNPTRQAITATINPVPVATVSGVNEICAGASTTLTASGGTSYVWSNAATTASISVTPAATTTYTVTVTNIQGCTATSSYSVNVKSIPTITINKVDHPCGGITLTANGGTSYAWSNGATTQIIDVNPLFFTTYRVTVTNALGCTASSSIAVQINTGPEATACLDFPSGRAPCFGTIEICEGELAGLRGKAYGNGPFTFNWDNGVGAGADHDILLSADGLETKNYIFTLTVTDTNGCTSSSEATVIVRGKPAAAISGPNIICHAGSTVLTASGVGTYLWSNGATTSTINVSPTTLTTYTVTVTNSYGCTDTASKSVDVSSNLNVSIDYKGSVCLETNKQISANVSGGTPAYTYQWTGPSGFTGNTETITITNNGNYYLTVTDVNGCSAVTSGFIYQQFDPFIVSLNTTVCEGESVNLQVNSSSAVSYQWSANAGNAIVNAVTVIPTLPSSTYLVTVTNDLGCTAVPSVVINVNPKPIVSVSGATNICPGTTTNLTPATGGTWSSTNPSVATVTNAGVVTGWSAGTATFIFTNTSTGCISNPSTQVTVNPTPIVSISGPSTICISSTTQLLPSSGGTWVSNNPSIATVNNMGVVTGISSGNTTFVFTSSTTGCVSSPTAPITIESKQGVVISGPSEVCMGNNIQLTSSKSGGSWSSSNTSVATINAAGIITTISSGSVIISYVHNSGACSEDATKAIIVHAIPTVTFTGSNSICLNQMTNLSPNSGGTWVSNHPSIATVNNAGLVTGIAAGNATFTFTNTATGCVSSPSAQLTVNGLPTVQITGASSLCINQMTTLSPSFGGTWSSSNPSVASVTVDGTVTALNAGTAYFTFTSAATSCSSTTSSPVVVAARPTVSVAGNKHVCIGGTTTLSPSSGGTWVSNNPSVASVSNTGIVTGLALGTVSFTFTSSVTGCVSLATEDVTVISNPTVTLDYNGSVCLTNNSSLSALASQGTPSYQYSWTGPNTFTGNTQTVSITQNGNYNLTITDSKGCMATTSGFVYQKYEPVIVNTQNTVCQGTSVNLQVNASGTPTYQWSPNAGNSNNAQVTVIPTLPGSTYYVTVTNSQGCSVVANATINVNEKPIVTLTGPNAICVGASTTFTPNTNGTWVSSNPLIATISNTGIVTGVGAGNVHFIYTNSATSCASDISPTIQVKAKPGISLDGEDAICIGATTKFLPGAGGTWASTNPSVASINNAGVVTAISAGQSTFVFTNTVSGCSSDASAPITIKPKPNAMFVGSQSVCAGGTTQLAPSTGGTWITSNSAVAIVNSSGLVTGLTPGQARFTFVNLSTLCYSDEIGPVTVEAKPLVSITGPNQLCTGSTTQLSPSTGGTWVSNNPSVASVTNGGLVTALSEGQATFRYTNSVTGCVSSNTNVVTVYGRPSVGFSGASTICIGSTTNLYPANGGVWVSSHPSIASVGNNGVVTGLAAGTATFTFTETATGCTSSIPTPLTVGAKPTINDGGSATLCVGQTKSMTPNTGGYWSSNHPSIASITNNGVVTALSQGVTNFYFTADNGCISDPSAPVAVSAKPSIATEANANLCVNTTLKLTSSTTGVWTSSNPSVATIANDGLISALNAGQVTFRIADANSGCLSENSQLFTVVGRPNISTLGANHVCIGNTTNLSPTTGGTWVSNDPTIASITNAGVVTGIMSGAATFSFTETSTGCTSTGVITINVNPKPIVTTDFSSLCIGSTGVISPSTGGTWVSQNPTIASINNSGVVTGLRQGVTRFLFTSTATGCTSNSSAPIVILGKPSITLNGSNEICIGTTTTLFPTTGGTWVSDNPTVASINNQGIVTGLSEGQARFIFTDANTGCSSDLSPAVTVGNSLQVSITGATSICLGYTTQLSPTVGGMWTSSNPSIAKVNGLGIVTGMAPGKVTFYFTASETGCISTLQENVLTVHSCIDPDFNVTSIHKTVVGNVQTNDDVPVGTTYGTSPFLVSRPSGSVVTFVMNTNGTYAFTADKPGVYTYNVPVCMPSTFQGCPTAVLTITVVDSQSGSMSMIPNIDIVSTTINQAVTIFATSNDKCLNGIDCIIDPDKMNVIDGPANGTATINTAGAIIYTPTSGFVGLDTVVYRICADATTTNCVNTMQIITVNAPSAVNTTVAADDFYTSYKDIALTGNVLINDNDPEGNNQVVTPQGSVGNPINVSQGSYYLLSNGELSFTPNEGYTGPVDIVYTVCDDQVQSVCAKATAHILIIEDMSIRIRVYLEGALINNGNQKATDNRPLMRDNLRVNPFNGTNVIPHEDPYMVATQYVNISNAFPHKASGLLTKYRSIKNPTTVLAVSGQDAIVDWVFVELRSKNDNREVLATRSGLLQRDGDVVDVDGISPLAFSGVLVDSFYVVVRHRNHLGVMSQKVSNRSLIDFTKPSTPVFDFGTSLNNGYDYTGLAQKSDIVFGYSCMWGGDFDSNGRIKFVNPGDDQNILFFDVFASPENSQNTSNYNFALAYHQGDFDLNGKAKFDNPNDDKNYLFSQVLLHPLNSGLLSNFNFIIEQIPSRK
ncbi:MAG TPA: Ig-like domain-containing protein [Saprospiraceae bacterium]|nr:Ig-like domain-containing protein [Saprospiraceae bacterium]